MCRFINLRDAPDDIEWLPDDWLGKREIPGLGLELDLKWLNTGV